VAAVKNAKKIMRLKIEIEMDGAAFEPDNGTEAARILRELADDMEGGIVATASGSSATLRDINGNRVGEATVT
jgi:hypothetical protein